MAFKKSMMNIKNLVLSMAVSGVAFTAAAQMQQPQQQQQNPQQQTPQPQQPGGTDSESAEEKYSEGELEKFVEVVQQVMPLQKEKEQEMVEEIKGAGLTVDRFNEIMQTQQGAAPGQAKGGEEKEVTEDEKASFQEASQNVKSIQKEMQTEVKQKIQDAGLTLQKYQEIMMAYQQDPNLQQKVNGMMDM